MAALKSKSVLKKQEVSARPNLAHDAYEAIKQSIVDFRLQPGQRFSENTIANQLGMSRTPVREALHKLDREGYISVSPNSGWHVTPLDFALFEQLYELRMLLEQAALTRLCGLEELPDLNDLKEIWLVTKEDRLTDAKQVAQLDEDFHVRVVSAAGNPEITRIYTNIVQRIRIIRRLDFTQSERVETTYEEHAKILRAILRRRKEQASILLKAHIDASMTEVRKITLHKLYMAGDRHL